MTKDELVDKLVELYTSAEIPVTAAGGVFAFTYGDQVVDVYSPTELMNAAAAKDTRIKPRYQAELGSAFNMYRYFKSHPIVSATKPSMVKIEGARQRIVYGAPGTGKSFGIDDDLSGADGKAKAICIRTTFHPDSDYSTFVGAYKPTKEDARITYNFRPQAFMNAYVAAWKEAAKGEGGKTRTDNVKKPYVGLNAVMVNVVNALIAEGGKGVEKSRKDIIAKAIELSGGEFGEQSFVPSDYCYNRVNSATTLTRPALFEFLGDGKYKCLGAEDSTYTGNIFWREKGSDVDELVGQCTAGVRKLAADEPSKPVVLVIEEINRGNCAQIFGDLFQLLDRNESGYSTYPICADVDLAKWLSEDEQFGEGLDGLERPSCIRAEDWDDVLKGRKLALPPTLYIWATMNTSDQSLFPIDSAFKRRWDWKYVPIREGKYKDGSKKGQKLGWKIKFNVPAHQEGSQQIPSKDYSYDWWEFLKNINAKIFKTTESEDKKLGYFFVKPDGEDATTNDGTISADRFVSKVIFYLWNDVFKDYGIETIFKVDDAKKSDDEAKGVEFQAFFNEEDDKADVNTLLRFLKHIELKSDEEIAAAKAAQQQQTASAANQQGQNTNP